MEDKPLRWLHAEVKSPPLSTDARRWAGFMLRELQAGQHLSMPDSRPMPDIGVRCHELRIRDPETKKTWRIVYRIDDDAIVIAEVFAKKTQETPKRVVETCKRRLRAYDAVSEEAE